MVQGLMKLNHYHTKTTIRTGAKVFKHKLFGEVEAVLQM